MPYRLSDAGTHCVGSDEDGESMYSCALAKTSQDQRRKALSGHAHRAYQVLCNLLIDKGYECVPKRGMKPQKVVRITDFKDDFNKAGIAETDNPDSLGKAFHRAKASLTN